MERSAGVFLPVASLPGPQGVGTFGIEADIFLGWLKSHGFRSWQMLPVNPLGPHACPYASSSSFAIETLYIDWRIAKNAGLLTTEPGTHLNVDLNLIDIDDGSSKKHGVIDYSAASLACQDLLSEAFESYLRQSNQEITREFTFFKEHSADWLPDWTLFQELTILYGTDHWHLWPDEMKRRDPDQLQRQRQQFHWSLERAAFGQFLAHKSLLNLRKSAEAHGIQLIGDLPIYVSHASADVWSAQESFQLQLDGSPEFVSGVPPDALCTDGQIWNHPLYDWQAQAKDQYHFWRRRTQAILRFFHRVRLDHFIGFCRYFQIPQGAKAADGAWQIGPGAQLFKELSDAITEGQNRPMPALPFIAEDLGAVAGDVIQLRDQFGLPGMGVMVFALTGDDQHAPENVAHNMVYYTSTHDTDTLAGVALELSGNRSASDEASPKQPKTGQPSLLQRAAASKAQLAIFPWQDIMGLGSEARMNRPGVEKGQWLYRALPSDLGSQPWIAHMLRESGRFIPG